VVFITFPFKLTFPYFSSIFQPHTNDIIFSLFCDFFNKNFFSFPLSYNGVISKTIFQVTYNFSIKLKLSFIFYSWFFQSLRAGTHGSYDAAIFLAFVGIFSASGGIVAAAFQGWAQPLGCDSGDAFCWARARFSQIFLILHTLNM